VASTTVCGRSGPFILREDVIRFPDGADAVYTVLSNPDSAFVVPYFDNGDTVLVRQWRHAWDQSSWEVPAGTFNVGEDPLVCARRELAEETGLVAARYRSLGIVHGAAFLTGSAHLFLAESITESERHPETYEQDMEVLRLPFIEALQAALDGQIVHSGSVTALTRAARALKLLQT
jgi:8-oxo-dGTP pyrophosphatase MutT (NUDIX family)